MAEFDFSNVKRIISPKGVVESISIDGETVWVSGALSEGLNYALQEDNTYCVIGYSGDHDKVLIPATYNDLPVTKIEMEAFYVKSQDSTVREITLPETITLIEDRAFWYCKKLTSINIPSSVKNIDGMAFWSCTNLSTIIIPANTRINGGPCFDGCLNLVICTEKTKPSSVSNIYTQWYYGCPVVWDYLNNDVADDGYIYTIVDNIRYQLKDGVAEVSGKSVYNEHETVSFPSNIEYKSQQYPLRSVSGGAFGINQNSIKSVIIPNGVISVGNFSFCSSLTNIEIPNSVTSIGRFESCTALTSIELPDSVTSIPQMFCRDCSSLQSVTLSKNITEIPKQAFLRCEELSSINIPDGVISIGENAFAYCRKLTNIIIPYGVTSIGKSAFTYCTSITSITIPSSVTTISANTFSGWKDTQTIYCEATSKPDGWSDSWLGTFCEANVVWGYKP